MEFERAVARIPSASAFPAAAMAVPAQKPRGACAGIALRSFWLLVISLIAASSQTYDWPGAIEPFLRRTLNITGEQLAALYSAYHAPNVVVVILGGIVIDLIGPDSASVGFTAIILLSAIVLASKLSLGTLLVSRVLLGIGGESVQVAQLALLNRAFDRGGDQASAKSLNKPAVPLLTDDSQASAADRDNGKPMTATASAMRATCCGNTMKWFDASDATGSPKGKSSGGGVGCCSPGAWDDFPTIAFAYATSNVVLRAVTLTILYVLPGLVNNYGWPGIGLVTAFGVGAFLFSLLLLAMERGWVKCCDVRAYLVDSSAASPGTDETPSIGPDSANERDAESGAAGAVVETRNPLTVASEEGKESGSGGGVVLAAATTGAVAAAQNAISHTQGTGNVTASVAVAVGSTASAATSSAGSETHTHIGPEFDLPDKHRTTNELLLLSSTVEKGDGSSSESKDGHDDDATETTPMLVQRRELTTTRAASGGSGDPTPQQSSSVGTGPAAKPRGCLLCFFSCSCKDQKACRMANSWCCSTSPAPGPDKPGTAEARCFAWLNVFQGDFCTPALLVHAAFSLLFTASSLPFGEINTALFSTVYGYGDEKAARTSSIQVIVSLASMIPYGILLDSRLIGYHSCMIFGTILTALAWALLAVASSSTGDSASAAFPSVTTESIPPQIPIALAGLGGAAINTAVWPMLGFRLPREVQGRVFGLLTAVQNGVMILSPLIIGALRDLAIEKATAAGSANPLRASFPPAMWFLFAGMLVCLILLVLLGCLDGWEEPRHKPHLDARAMRVLGNAAPLEPMVSTAMTGSVIGAKATVATAVAAGGRGENAEVGGAVAADGVKTNNSKKDA